MMHHIYRSVVNDTDWYWISQALIESGSPWPLSAMMVDLDFFDLKFLRHGTRRPGRRKLAKRWNTTEHHVRMMCGPMRRVHNQMRRSA